MLIKLVGNRTSSKEWVASVRTDYLTMEEIEDLARFILKMRPKYKNVELQIPVPTPVQETNTIEREDTDAK